MGAWRTSCLALSSSSLRLSTAALALSNWVLPLRRRSCAPHTHQEPGQQARAHVAPRGHAESTGARPVHAHAHTRAGTQHGGQAALSRVKHKTGRAVRPWRWRWCAGAHLQLLRLGLAALLDLLQLLLQLPHPLQGAPPPPQPAARQCSASHTWDGTLCGSIATARAPHSLAPAPGRPPARHAPPSAPPPLPAAAPPPPAALSAAPQARPRGAPLPRPPPRRPAPGAPAAPPAAAQRPAAAESAGRRRRAQRARRGPAQRAAAPPAHPHTHAHIWPWPCPSPALGRPVLWVHDPAGAWSAAHLLRVLLRVVGAAPLLLRQTRLQRLHLALKLRHPRHVRAHARSTAHRSTGELISVQRPPPPHCRRPCALRRPLAYGDGR